MSEIAARQRDAHQERMDRKRSLTITVESEEASEIFSQEAMIDSVSCILMKVQKIKNMVVMKFRQLIAAYRLKTLFCYTKIPRQTQSIQLSRQHKLLFLRLCLLLHFFSVCQLRPIQFQWQRQVLIHVLS